ncbi:MAG: hypothetical protein IPQ07_23555 [Myxococcales bacterium]|nr:hypothetical protein [Myxococcales bacterium]
MIWLVAPTRPALTAYGPANAVSPRIRYGSGVVAAIVRDDRREIGLVSLRVPVVIRFTHSACETLDTEMPRTIAESRRTS